MSAIQFYCVIRNLCIFFSSCLVPQIVGCGRSSHYLSKIWSFFHFRFKALHDFFV